MWIARKGCRLYFCSLLSLASLQVLCRIQAAGKAPTIHIPIPDQVCPLCEIVVHLVEGELQNNSTQKEIEVTLQKACSLMPQNDQQQCRNMVDVYTGYIIGMLESLATAEQICQTLGLCPTRESDPFVWGV